MGELSDKPAIADLVRICYDRGLRKVLISPGSRNAPLSISFLGHGGFDVQIIGDERVAAFIGLGMSQVDLQATILVCTSGSAMLNYLPAVSEAYYQRIPLLIFTADRPEEWVDQMEGQTMRQRGAMSNFVNQEFHLPQEADIEDRRWYSGRLVNEAITASRLPKCGPVHVNVPLKEPLYGTSQSPERHKSIEYSSPAISLPQDYKSLLEQIDKTDKVMILLGLEKTANIDPVTLDSLIEKGVVILNETSTNAASDRILSWIDRSIAALPKDASEYLPDLLITAGGPLISKRIKTMLRGNRIDSHWHVDPVEPNKDLFQSLSRSIYCDEGLFIEGLAVDVQQKDKAYATSWSALNKEIEESHKAYLAKVEFSDLKAYEIILNGLPEHSKVQMANSAAVRYVQLFANRKDISYFGNRGVSGIEGCTSTALGMATQVEDPVILLTGDMAFRYDANAFWTGLRPNNLKCIVINNQGGGIFRIIPGPDSTEHLETAFEAHQENSAHSLAQMYGIKYIAAEDEESLSTGLKDLFESNELTVLEVFTPREKNAEILRAYFQSLGT